MHFHHAFVRMFAICITLAEQLTEIPGNHIVMNSEDVTTGTPLDVTMDRSPDSGVSTDSKDSTPTEATTDVSAHFKICTSRETCLQ